MRRLRSAFVQVKAEIRKWYRLAELQRAGNGCHRDKRRRQLWDAPRRGALQPLRQPSRPRISGWAAADSPALLHQRRGVEFQAGERSLGCAASATPAVRRAVRWLEGDALALRLAANSDRCASKFERDHAGGRV